MTTDNKEDNGEDKRGIFKDAFRSLLDIILMLLGIAIVLVLIRIIVSLIF